MRRTFLASAFLVGILTLDGLVARAQQQPPPAPPPQGISTDLAVTYTTLGSKVTPGGNNFWLQGGSIDAGFTLHRGFGLAANITGDHASNIAPGVNLDEIDFVMGPRYTYRLGSKSKHESRVFAEVLAGGVRGFGSVFPKSTGLDTRASSFTYQVGGGWDISIKKHIAIRVFEADYVRSYLPNNGGDTQGHIRLAFGVTYHMAPH